MARAPTRVGATSGQGVSRRSYQAAYSMGAKGTGSPAGGIKLGATVKPAGGASISGQTRTYSKSNRDNGGSFNIAYSDREFKNPDLKSLTDYPAPKGKGSPKGFFT
jgi:hypothetical protein